MSRQFWMIVVLATLWTGLSTGEVTAQNTFRRQRPLRWLGQGFGDGYHRCNPGYDSSHYNPYSAHNSFLYSQSPQFQQLSNKYNYVGSRPQGDLQFFGGIPFSVYAAPPGATANRSPGQFQGRMIESAFEPAKPDDEGLAEDGLDLDTDNSFEPDQSIFGEEGTSPTLKSDPSKPNSSRPGTAETNEFKPDALKADVARPDVAPQAQPAPQAERMLDNELEEPLPPRNRDQDRLLEERLPEPQDTDSTFHLPVLEGRGVQSTQVSTSRKR